MSKTFFPLIAILIAILVSSCKGTNQTPENQDTIEQVITITSSSPVTIHFLTNEALEKTLSGSSEIGLEGIVKYQGNLTTAHQGTKQYKFNVKKKLSWLGVSVTETVPGTMLNCKWEEFVNKQLSQTDSYKISIEENEDALMIPTNWVISYFKKKYNIPDGTIINGI